MPFTDKNQVAVDSQREEKDLKTQSYQKHSKSLSRTGTKKVLRHSSVRYDSGIQGTSSINQEESDYTTVTKRVGGGYSSFAYPKEDQTKPKSVKKESVKVKFLAISKRKS